ncbi:MAG: bifunctional riboflavin kinase/FAD synthetase [Halioglobus sp.]
MELIRGLHNLRPRHRGCVATIGAFDGVHLGHQAVLGYLLAKAEELSLPSLVIVFEPLPREYFSPLQAPARLMSFREKFRAMEALGVDRILRIRFTPDLQTMTAQQFIDEIFVTGLDAKHIVLGDDFRFGNDRDGDITLLQEQGARYGFTAESTPTRFSDEERVSSTRIRQVLEQADFTLAEKMLGRPYSITGKVIYGRQLGRTLGTPTANLELNRLRAPLKGVYAVRVNGAGLNSVAGVANVGTRPTIDDSIKANLEVHMLDFDENIYGKTIEVRFLKKLRDEQKFASVEELRQHISQDIEQARSWFNSDAGKET